MRFPGRVVAIGVVAVACSEVTAPSPVIFSATLSGAREIPANGTPATGAATFTLTGNQLAYTVTASGLTTPIALAHVHIGASGQVGPVVVPLQVLSQSGVITAGRLDLSDRVTYNTLTITGDSLKSLMRSGLTYVNVFTVGYPGGEIRGQLLQR